MQYQGSLAKRVRIDLDSLNKKGLSKGSCLVHLDTDYPGEEINRKTKDKRNSYQECRTLCEETAGCNAYSYNQNDKHCWLKSSISRSIHYGHSVSGKPCKKCK